MIDNIRDFKESVKDKINLLEKKLNETKEIKVGDTVKIEGNIYFINSIEKEVINICPIESNHPKNFLNGDFVVVNGLAVEKNTFRHFSLSDAICIVRNSSPFQLEVNFCGIVLIVFTDNCSLFDYTSY